MTLELFNLKDTLECGQCFRYKKLSENYYRVVAKSKVIDVRQNKDQIIIEGDAEENWIHYFDQNRDYTSIREKLSENDPIMAEAMRRFGIRILNQDRWECLISFIISQNNNIPRIQKLIEILCLKYGKPLEDQQHAFPTTEELTNVSVSDLNKLGFGYRSPYIVDAVRRVKLWREFEKFDMLSTPKLLATLREINGIGPKVSNCIALFSFERFEVFPIDTWIKKSVQELYFGGRKVSEDRIFYFAQERFGEYAGYAQQCLFHYIRTRN